MRPEEGHLAWGGHGVALVGPWSGAPQLQELVVGQKCEVFDLAVISWICNLGGGEQTNKQTLQSYK